MAASANPLLQEKQARDPTLFATAYKKQRFYLFSRSEPECVQTWDCTRQHSADGCYSESSKHGDRDVFNERPTREDQSIALAQPDKGPAATATDCVIHTNMGDIVRNPARRHCG